MQLTCVLVGLVTTAAAKCEMHSNLTFIESYRYCGIFDLSYRIYRSKTVFDIS